MTRNKPGAKKGRKSRAKATKRAVVGRQEPAPKDTPPVKDEFFERLPPSLQKEMSQLLKSEAKIVKALEKEEMQQLFISNPAAALTKMRLSVPPALKRRLKPEADLQALLQPRQFRLANGQVITPRVRIRFERK